MSQTIDKRYEHDKKEKKVFKRKTPLRALRIFDGGREVNSLQRIMERRELRADKNVLGYPFAERVKALENRLDNESDAL